MTTQLSDYAPGLVQTLRMLSDEFGLLGVARCVEALGTTPIEAVDPARAESFAEACIATVEPEPSEAEVVGRRLLEVQARAAAIHAEKEGLYAARRVIEARMEALDEEYQQLHHEHMRLVQS